MNERLPGLVKELRKESSGVKLKSLMSLDRSDRILIEGRLVAIINELLLIQTIGEAHCSVVVEMFEHMGGVVPTCQSFS